MPPEFNPSESAGAPLEQGTQENVFEESFEPQESVVLGPTPSEPSPTALPGAESQGQKKPDPQDEIIQAGDYRGPRSGLDAFLRKRQSDFNRLQEEVNQLRRQPVQTAPVQTAQPPAPAGPQPPSHELLLEDPAAYHAQMLAFTKHEIQSGVKSALSPMEKRLAQDLENSNRRTITDRWNGVEGQIPGYLQKMRIPEQFNEIITAAARDEAGRNTGRYASLDENNRITEFNPIDAVHVAIGKNFLQIVDQIHADAEKGALERLKSGRKANASIPAQSGLDPSALANGSKAPAGMAVDEYEAMEEYWS